MEATIKYYDGISNDDSRIVNLILANNNIKIINTIPERFTTYNLLTTFKIENIEKLNSLLVELNSKTQNGVILVETKVPQIKTKNKFFKKKASSCKTFIGYVGQYSDCWLFETDTTSYSQQVCAAIDELMGELSNNGDKFKITIKKLGEKD